MPDEFDDFDTAKEIAKKLSGLEPERRNRILRWIAESLGMESGLGERLKSEIAVAVASSHARKTDLRSFVNEKQPKNDVQFATVVAYYYQFEAPENQRRDEINAAFLREATRLANRARLKSPSDTLNNAKKYGYLDAGKTRGAFSVNTVGENLVAMTLGSEKPIK